MTFNFSQLSHYPIIPHLSCPQALHHLKPSPDHPEIIQAFKAFKRSSVQAFKHSGIQASQRPASRHPSISSIPPSIQANLHFPSQSVSSLPVNNIDVEHLSQSNALLLALVSIPLIPFTLRRTANSQAPPSSPVCSPRLHLDIALHSPATLLAVALAPLTIRPLKPLDLQLDHPLSALMSVDRRQSFTCLRYPSRSETVSRTQLSKVHTGDLNRPID